MTASEWNVLVTETAYQDLREAAAYMRDALLPPSAAKTFIDAFEEAVGDLYVWHLQRGKKPHLPTISFNWQPDEPFTMPIEKRGSTPGAPASIPRLVHIAVVLREIG